MPARVSTGIAARTPEEVRSLAVQLAGFIDDPIAFVRIRWGAYNAGSRILTLQVIDRLEKDYAPRAFKGYKRRPNSQDGRWVVAWYIANSEFGTPVDCAGSYTKGKQFANISGFYLSETDSSGQIKLTISKGGDQTWCHAGVIGLLRSRGINWATAPDDADTSAGGSSGGGGSAGSGDIVVAKF